MPCECSGDIVVRQIVRDFLASSNSFGVVLRKGNVLGWDQCFETIDWMSRRASGL